MKRYILLRDNKESGPYTVEQLQELVVQPTDLLWVDGESTHWQKAASVNGFALSASRGNDQPARVAMTQGVTSTPAATTVPFDFDTWAQSKTAVRDAESETLTAGTSKKNKAVWAGLGASLLIGLFVAVKSSNLLNQQSNNTIPASAATKGANISLPTVPKTVSDATAKSWGRKAGLALERLRKPGELRKGISVGVNDYDADFFGGINDLQLTVINTSVYTAARVKVKLDYHRPGGDVIETKVVTVRNVPAQGEKMVPVEDTKRGVRVSTTILSMQ